MITVTSIETIKKPMMMVRRNVSHGAYASIGGGSGCYTGQKVYTDYENDPLSFEIWEEDTFTWTAATNAGGCAGPFIDPKAHLCWIGKVYGSVTSQSCQEYYPSYQSSFAWYNVVFNPIAQPWITASVWVKRSCDWDEFCTLCTEAGCQG